MATVSPPPLDSYSTALVVLPPPHIQSRINALRSANDKSYPRWTSHITLTFPFVEPSALPIACSLIRNALREANISPFSCKLDDVGMFEHQGYDTVYLRPSQAMELHRIWDVVKSAVSHSGRAFVPHLTLGQTRHRGHSIDLLRGKGRLLLEQEIEWDVYSVVVLCKAERGVMKIYDEIVLSSNSIPPSEAVVADLHSTPTYHFGPQGWLPYVPGPITSKSVSAFSLATYNVLSDSDFPLDSRFPRLLSNILAIQPVPDVLCLQEVTDKLLRRLLAEPSIRTRWPCCTHDPANVLPNENNIVFLTNDASGFTWEFVQLRRHKPAVILKVPRDQAEPLVIAGVHLTAGLEASHRHAKLDELKTLFAFLTERFAASPWIIMGDFNIPTSQVLPSPIVDIFHDAWFTVHGSDDGGATYDPGSNALAAKTVKEDHSPQRYDRVWIRRNMGISFNSAELFGQGDEEASDHFGLTVSLSISSTEGKGIFVARVVNLPQDSLGTATLAGEDRELQKFVYQEGGFPTPSQQSERANVTAILQAFFSFRSHGRDTQTTSESPSDPTPPQSAVRLEFVPVGSFGLGVDTEGSDVDVLVVGNISPRTFWSLARSLIRMAASKSRVGDVNKESVPDVILKRYIKDASVPMMELVVGNIRVDMHYCSASRLLESWGQIHTLLPTDPVFLLPGPSLRILNGYRDLLAVLRVLPTSSLPSFRLAYRALKLFCISHGLYSSKLGYLGGIHLTLLLTRTTLVSPPNSSPTQLIYAFFCTYADWDWAQNPVTIPGINDNSAYTRAVGREPMVILSMEKPLRNVAQLGNQHTLSAIDSSFKLVRQRLREGTPWSDVCGSGGLCGSIFKTEFLTFHESYIKVDLLVWCSNTAKARVWISFVESRLLHLLVLLQTSLPGSNARLWPTRLIDTDSSPGHLTSGLQTFYLIGSDSPVESLSGEKVQALLLAFEDQLRRDEKFYDSTEMFVSVTNVAPSQLPKDIATSPPWEDGDVDPDEASDEEEFPEPSDEERDPDAAFAPITSRMLKQNRPQQLKGSNTPHLPAPKLRTSSDVYHRILWDKELNAEDFLIGYEDRFSGLKEVSLTSWRRDIEDEDFIPFHRVVHFRRKSDGVLVWNRRNKTDLIFGSGVQKRSS